MLGPRTAAPSALPLINSHRSYLSICSPDTPPPTAAATAAAAGSNSPQAIPQHRPQTSNNCPSLPPAPLPLCQGLQLALLEPRAGRSLLRLHPRRGVGGPPMRCRSWREGLAGRWPPEPAGLHSAQGLPGCGRLQHDRGGQEARGYLGAVCGDAEVVVGGPPEGRRHMCAPHSTSLQQQPAGGCPLR